jgi:RHH-type proline utilization regulon transcriptional repressor/proline dehydrogenase/delta 1-pyrroline-5-carboxylate dehydrogenase
MLCISPWNFPLAIFIGQVAAALVAGNTVIAKPALRTSLTAFAATRLLHKAGIPRGVLHLIPGSGPKLSKVVIDDLRLQGVLFTGSFEVAKTLQRQLAARPGPIIPLIAETGGQNALVVDSTALPEQVVSDVLRSAFDSAGQRCSALRLLCLQEDIAAEIETMLAGAMATLRVGDPAQFDTDVGPLIDRQAKARLQRQLRRLRGKKTRLIAETPIPAAYRGAAFFAPRAYAIDSVDQLKDELFGPVLHVLRYPTDGFENMLDDINRLGYGLTSGLHSRIAARHELFQQRLQAGNLYINRDLIGAVPGVQPFGGFGLSGTGPKAGGPNYLLRLVHEQSISTNTAAMGGNASLLAQKEDD